MLNALTVVLAGADQSGAQRAQRSMERQGFRAASECGLSWDGGEFFVWSNPQQRAVADFAVATAVGFACCVGPMWYRGRFGIEALRLILDAVEVTGEVDESGLRGNFALFVRTKLHCLLLNDALGFVRLYASPDRKLYSSSWLATCAYSGKLDVDAKAAVEYVLLGAAHSECTVARGVSTLRLAHVFDLARRSERPRTSWNLRDSDADCIDFETTVERIAAHLGSVCDEIAAAFSGRTRSALSGGFDSRLILAGMLASGQRPHLFVYGGAGTDDVRIAQQVADAAGLHLEVIDKRVLNGTAPRPSLEQLVESACFFDGLPNDGIDDPGADRRTRMQQTADGCIALNGGGGEIIRNFFHLPDRCLSSRDIVRAFYRGFDARVFRQPSGLAAYEGALEASMERALGIVETPPGGLRREQVELLYPLFRCHHWMSVNNSVGVRHGCYATPLVDADMVRVNASLPLAWKQAGRLESRLIAALHAGVASQSSSYGFRFSDGPGWRARIAEWVTCMRPISLRPFINASRRRLCGLGVAPDMVAHYRALLPGEWRLDPVLDLAQLPDNAAFARALAVEVVWRELLA